MKQAVLKSYIERRANSLYSSLFVQTSFILSSVLYVTAIDTEL